MMQSNLLAATARAYEVLGLRRKAAFQLFRAATVFVRVGWGWKRDVLRRVV